MVLFWIAVIGCPILLLLSSILLFRQESKRVRKEAHEDESLQTYLLTEIVKRQLLWSLTRWQFEHMDALVMFRKLHVLVRSSKLSEQRVGELIIGLLGRALGSLDLYLVSSSFDYQSADTDLRELIRDGVLDYQKSSAVPLTVFTTLINHLELSGLSPEACSALVIDVMRSCGLQIS